MRIAMFFEFAKAIVAIVVLAIVWFVVQAMKRRTLGAICAGDTGAEMPGCWGCRGDRSCGTDGFSGQKRESQSVSQGAE
jgi:MFS superfamily sulfate permease-like transporter